LGEVGRPHYEVEPEIMAEANALFQEALAICAELSCPAILHTEAGDPDTFQEWATWADEAGLPREKVVKHFAPPLVTPEENHGLVPSLVASRGTLEEALERSDRFFMETDYMDDPDRPGAVLGPKVVPRRTLQFHEDGRLTEDAWARIHIDLPRQVYGIETN
ncbi:MAG: TatD family hydrolase, partial [Candidatus Thermoplasmatota archaeon]|nr:TatD family hydrolase [Candidatus Thermoplasmatota archaeon]